MKKIIVFILAAVMALTLCACGPSDAEIAKVREVSFRGTELTVTLGTNKSTGYEWDFEIYGDCIKQSINKSFKILGRQGDATGEVSIGFEGLSEGSAVIVFTTPNGWDGSGNGDAYTVNVDVAANGAIVSAVGTEGANAPEITPEPLAYEYVEILKSGSYQYSYIVPYDGAEMTTTEAAKDGDTVYKVAMGEAGSRIVQRDGRYYAIDDKTGEMTETTAEKNLGGDLDFSAMALISSETREGKVFEKYSMFRNGQPREFTFVFENGALIGLAFSYVENDAPYFAAVEFTGEADETLFEIPEEKATLKIDELAEGTYTGELSGCSYSNDKGTVLPTMSPAELTVTIQNGQITLYSEIKVIADGMVEGVKTPPSPEYTVILSGTLPLVQSSDTVVSAAGEAQMLGENINIFYEDGEFTHWEVKERKEGSTFQCSVSIAMADGIPTAEITASGNKSQQTATLPLALNTAGAGAAAPASADVEGEWLSVDSGAGGSQFYWKLNADGTYTLSLMYHNADEAGSAENWNDGNWETAESVSGTYSVSGNTMQVTNGNDSTGYVLAITFEDNMLYTVDEDDVSMDFERIGGAAAAQTSSAASAAAEVLWTNSNIGAVQNDAKDYYVMFDLPACTVTEIETYHYLSDGKAPGELMLFGEDGSEYGPFDAVGREGQGGVANAYWVAEVNIELPAGQYAIADSDPITWSNNEETDGWGMATVRGIPK